MMSLFRLALPSLHVLVLQTLYSMINCMVFYSTATAYILLLTTSMPVSFALQHATDSMAHGFLRSSNPLALGALERSHPVQC